MTDFRELTRKEKELARKKNEMKELDIIIKANKAKASQSKASSKKKFVQTSLFEPSIKKEK